jgi:cell division protein FtsZ
MSHDAYKRDHAPEPWEEEGEALQEEPKEQEDQWAILRHEAEKEHTQWQEGTTQSGWNHRDTDDTPAASPSSYDPYVEALRDVDIVVAGVGGGGMNAINRMISARVRGVRFVAMNTDAQVLSLSLAPNRISLGQHHTKGLGAGGNAAVGMRAATESSTEIRAALADADLVFIAAGMGGGTGTGAAPVVASIAKKQGALTIGIVTLPFTFEGTQRRRAAERGMEELSKEVDALITVPNDRLLTTVARESNLSEAFKIADDVLRQGVQGIAEVINVPGMINVDFADVCSTLREAGTALMSIGQGRGRNRAQQAADEAIAGGFLNVSIRGAKRVLFNISGGDDMTLYEVNEVAERIGEAIDHTADITFGAVIDPVLTDTIRVTLIAAGLEEAYTTRLEAVRIYQGRSTQLKGATSSQQAGQATRLSQNMSPAAPPPTRMPPPVRQQPSTPPSPPARPQRSLNDLRGLRGMGRRQEAPGEKNRQQADDNDDYIDVPPFLKRRE